MRPCTRLVAHIELENTGHHDDGMRAITVLKHCKFHCLSAVYEQATAEPFLVLDDPIAMAVPANLKKAWPGNHATRGRFRLAHGTVSLSSCGLVIPEIALMRVFPLAALMCLLAHMNSRVSPAHSHKRGIKVD